MLLLFVASIVAFVFVLYFGKRINPKVRIALAILVFLLANLPTVIVLVVGDQPLPGSRIVTHQELQKAAQQ